MILGLCDRLRPRQLDIEVDERNRERKDPPRDAERNGRDHGVGDPEGATSRHWCAPALAACASWIKPRSASAAIAASLMRSRSRRTSAVCSPSRGGGRSYVASLAENLI